MFQNSPPGASVFTSTLNIEEAVLYYCTGKLAPDKVIGVVSLSRASEKRREQGVFPLGLKILDYCFFNI